MRADRHGNPDRLETLGKIDAAIDSLSPKPKWVPLGSRERSRLELLHAIEEYRRERAYKSEMQSLLSSNFVGLEKIGLMAAQLADDLAQASQTGMFPLLGVDIAFIEKLRAITDAAARENLSILDQQPLAPRRGKGRPQADPLEVMLVQKAAVIYHGLTGRDATITKTEAGRTGPALSFINKVFKAAGIAKSAAHTLGLAKARIDALRQRPQGL